MKDKAIKGILKEINYRKIQLKSDDPADFFNRCMEEAIRIALKKDKSYYYNKFCYICGKNSTFHHLKFKRATKKNEDLPIGIVKKDGAEGIPLCREHHDEVEAIIVLIKKYKKIKKAVRLEVQKQKDKINNLNCKQLAEIFHNAYEQSAKKLNWETQKKCRVKFDDLPKNNKLTMINTIIIFKQKLLKLLEVGNKIKCNSCLKLKEEYVSGLCKKCADKMDKHIKRK